MWLSCCQTSQHHKHDQRALNMTDGMKKCLKCGVLKGPALFSKRALSPDGLQHWCKDCCKSNWRQHYAVHPQPLRRSA